MISMHVKEKNYYFNLLNDCTFSMSLKLCSWSLLQDTFEWNRIIDWSTRVLLSYHLFIGDIMNNRHASSWVDRTRNNITSIQMLCVFYTLVFAWSKQISHVPKIIEIKFGCCFVVYFVCIKILSPVTMSTHESTCFDFSVFEHYFLMHCGFSWFNCVVTDWTDLSKPEKRAGYCFLIIFTSLISSTIGDARSWT